jgi:hypothetical protein
MLSRQSDPPPRWPQQFILGAVFSGSPTRDAKAFRLQVYDLTEDKVLGFTEASEGCETSSSDSHYASKSILPWKRIGDRKVDLISA